MRFSIRALAAAGALAATALAAPAFARPTAGDRAAAAEAERRGAEMFAYDQAAWHASDRFQADLAAAGVSADALAGLGVRGYVVEPDGRDAFRVTFYAAREGSLRAYARYRHAAGVVSGEGILPDGADRALSPLAQRMAAARDKAVARMIEARLPLCSASPANTLILPRGDGGLSVYVLSSSTVAGVYPAGGHYRFDFDAAGTLSGERNFARYCAEIDSRPQGGQPAPTTNIAFPSDPNPSEVHTFISRNVPVGFIVMTLLSNAVWEVKDGRIRYLREIARQPKRK